MKLEVNGGREMKRRLTAAEKDAIDVTGYRRLILKKAGKEEERWEREAEGEREI